MDLSVNIAGVHLASPVLAASGTFAYGQEMEGVVDLKRPGAIITKGLSREPMPGNPSPRLFETAAGMLNSVGLQNIGVESFIRTRLPRLRELGITVITNVFGSCDEDYLETIDILNNADGVAAYELNVSCPNTRHGGMAFGTDPVGLQNLVARTKRAARRPLIVKLSPNVTSIAEMALISEQSGADALSIANTFVGMAIDAETRRPRFANVVAGLSGPAIKPLALRMVYEAHRVVRIPIVGVGGIASGKDAVEFMLAGAAAVQVGTANMWNPKAIEHVVAGIERYCAKHVVERVASLTGALQLDQDRCDVMGTEAPKTGARA